MNLEFKKNALTKSTNQLTDLEAKVKKQTHDLSADGVYHESNLTDLKHDPSVFQDYDGLRNVLPLGNSQLATVIQQRGELTSWKGNFTSPDLQREIQMTLAVLLIGVKSQLSTYHRLMLTWKCNLC